MEIVNATPLPARLDLARQSRELRAGAFVAKATYRVERGAAKLDSQEPIPILSNDLETELGLLPSDLAPFRADVCEVALLGAAYAPNGRSVPWRVVTMRVGAHEQRMLVVGDRHWQSSALGADTMSEPLPFARMPMTWDRAFGGGALVEIDREAFLAIEHTGNRLGRGYDVTQMAADTARAFGCPRGYPRYRRDDRLPNLEDPACPVTSRASDPLPLCWAPQPHEVAVRATALARRIASGGAAALDVEAAAVETTRRAHPTWVLPSLPRGRLFVDGCRPGAPIDLPLPSTSVVLDCHIGTREATLRCIPTMLVVMPEWSRFYIVYRTWFHARPGKASFRVRMEEG